MKNYLLFIFAMLGVVPALGQNSDNIKLNWVDAPPQAAVGARFGVPFSQGVLPRKSAVAPLLYTDSGEQLAVDSRVEARHSDGSVKWLSMATVVPANVGSLQLRIDKKNAKQNAAARIEIQKNDKQIQINTGALKAYIPTTTGSQAFLDSLVLNGTTVASAAWVVSSLEVRDTLLNNTTTRHEVQFASVIDSVKVEKEGAVNTVIRITGCHTNGYRGFLPFTLRLSFFAGSDQMQIVHSFVYDGEQDKDFIKSLGIRFGIPLNETAYNRHVLFAGAGNGVWHEPVQPLTGRRLLRLDGHQNIYAEQIAKQRIPEASSFDAAGQELISHWAEWDGYRLTQLSPDAFSIRKRALPDRPYIGTIEGTRSRGMAYAGDISGGIGVSLKDFWQSYPTSIEINGMRTDEASMTVYFWSPQAEAMDLRHYDDHAHDLNASYEDVQEGLSTPYGVARTSTLTLTAFDAVPDNKTIDILAESGQSLNQLVPTPEYLHQAGAFGVWSLPKRNSEMNTAIENYIDSLVEFYDTAIEEHGWYGFWNYGDFMHTYDPTRHSWLYDVGGYAWDNTELATNMFLWYQFLRTGRADLWRLAVAMTRHTSEVDVYHIGDLAGLGSRHNVTHWGCGAKEARISQAAWNRFMFYLTGGDERLGELMDEVIDADQLLYTLDPMRLAEPRELYPCTAPARLRIGPDWLAYAGNWMTHYERTGDERYRTKILAGMKSIGQLRHGLLTGPNALGYDPATGIITYEGDTAKQSTNHLMSLMGGFEINHELMQMFPQADWQRAWLDHAIRYNANGRGFRIPRLRAYAAWKLGDTPQGNTLRATAWRELTDGKKPQMRARTILPPTTLTPLHEAYVSTNGAATFALDAIFLLETISE